MQLKQIKVGRWYQTSRGIGQAVEVGGTWPPSVRIRIERPFPHGEIYLVPRDFQHEVPPPPGRTPPTTTE